MNNLQYSPDIVERIETLSLRANEKKRVIQDFIGILQDRVNLEDYYSRNLEKLGESLNRLIHGKDQMKEMFLLIRNYVNVQVEQSRALARSIKNEVAAEIQSMLKNESAWQKEVSDISKHHQKNVRVYIDRLNQVRQEYVLSIEEEMKARSMANYRQKFPKTRAQCEQQLKGYIEQYNKYIDQYFSDIATVQYTFTKLEVERRTCLQDASMKFLMYEVSYVRNLQYDLQGISQKMEQYDPKKDLAQLFQEPLSDKPLLSKLNFANYQTYIHQHLNYTPPQPQNQQPTPIKKIFEEPPNPPIEIKKRRSIFNSEPLQQAPQIPLLKQQSLEPDGSNPQLLKMFQTALFNNIVSDQSTQLLDEVIKSDESLLQSFPTSLNRVMELSVNQGEQQGIQVNPTGYISLNKILNVFLENVDVQHIQQIKKIMQLSTQIFKQVSHLENENHVEEITLAQGLYLNPLFEDLDRLTTWGIQKPGDKESQIQSILSFVQQLQTIGCKFSTAASVFDRLIEYHQIDDSLRERYQPNIDITLLNKQVIQSTIVEESELQQS